MDFGCKDGVQSHVPLRYLATGQVMRQAYKAGAAVRRASALLRELMSANVTPCGLAIKIHGILRSRHHGLWTPPDHSYSCSSSPSLSNDM